MSTCSPQYLPLSFSRVGFCGLWCALSLPLSPYLPLFLSLSLSLSLLRARALSFSLSRSLSLSLSLSRRIVSSLQEGKHPFGCKLCEALSQLVQDEPASG